MLVCVCACMHVCVCTCDILQIVESPFVFEFVICMLMNVVSCVKVLSKCLQMCIEDQEAYVERFL